MHDNTDIPGLTWTELTDADATSIRVQNLGDHDVWLQRGGATAPTSTGGAIRLAPGLTIVNEALSDLWPGAAGGRVWAWSLATGAVSVSHE